MNMHYTAGKTNGYDFAVLGLLMLTTITGCFKNRDLPDCSGNCADVVFSGRVYDSSGKRPLKGVRVKIFLKEEGSIFSPGDNYIIADDKTGSDGGFSFHTQYDTVNFASATLYVNTYIPDGYLHYPYQVVPNAESSAADGINTLVFSPKDFAAFSNLSFSLMQKTKLQVRMHRNTPINGGTPVNIELHANGVSSVSGFLQSEVNKDTTITVYTGSNVTTIITTTKAISFTEHETVRDTIVCTKDGANTADVYY